MSFTLGVSVFIFEFFLSFFIGIVKCLNDISFPKEINDIGGVTVSMLVWSVVDRVFVSGSDENKVNEIISCCFSTKHESSEEKRLVGSEL